MFALDLIAELRRHIDALEGQWLALVAEYDSSGDWYELGFLSTAAALRERCRMNAGHAAAPVALARKVAARPDLAEAFASGEISREHAQVIADAFTPVRTDALARGRLPISHVGTYRGCPGTDALDGDGGAATGRGA
jgi:hypothetical protein